uniref:Uncharacterized protein n=1 Tax=Metapenaeus joyneri majanivirus TaxID=2984280 RepID=A0A9C7CFI3_9VIRU|nr:MAG: hypothetical protein [Metapenaeus joyneri majanivirus]
MNNNVKPPVESQTDLISSEVLNKLQKDNSNLFDFACKILYSDDPKWLEIIIKLFGNFHSSINKVIENYITIIKTNCGLSQLEEVIKILNNSIVNELNIYTDDIGKCFKLHANEIKKSDEKWLHVKLLLVYSNVIMHMISFLEKKNNLYFYNLVNKEFPGNRIWYLVKEQLSDNRMDESEEGIKKYTTITEPNYSHQISQQLNVDIVEMLENSLNEIKINLNDIKKCVDLNVNQINSEKQKNM